MSRPYPRSSSPASFVRVNGKIRAREVRVIGVDGKQLGVFSLADAINMARSNGVDLVEIAPNAAPPVCRLVDYGKFRYEQSKRDKEAKKHQHANKVKEIQLSPSIDPHDFGVKLTHAVEFLCEEMKVKVTLRFRGRELAHKEFGFGQVEKFIKEVAPYGHPDAPPKLIGKGINVMLSPLPRNKRAKNPKQDEAHAAEEAQKRAGPSQPSNGPPGQGQTDGFANNPFSKLNIQTGQ
ncbi:MAG: translation initiation factor IF-3 [Verrucomicrobia subdivision 3 bacterium]|nr:translation initiation factor IF-3 [Limisphaerales bacterium]